MRWRSAGVRDRLLVAISEAYDGDIMMIDSSACASTSTAAGKRGADAGDGCMGHSRGGLTTKIDALVEADGQQVKLMLTPGQAGNAPVAASLLKDLAPGATLIADRAYDTDAIRELASERGAWANIPPRSIRKGSFAFSSCIYRQRNLVERFFNQTVPRSGDARRPATRELPRLSPARCRPYLACSDMSPHPSETPPIAPRRRVAFLPPLRYG